MGLVGEVALLGRRWRRSGVADPEWCRSGTTRGRLKAELADVAPFAGSGVDGMSGALRDRCLVGASHVSTMFAPNGGGCQVKAHFEEPFARDKLRPRVLPAPAGCG